MGVYLGIKSVCQACAVLFWLGTVVLLVTGRRRIITETNEWLEEHVVVGTTLTLVVFFGVMSTFLVF